MRKTNKASGFSLIELLVVMGVILVIGAIAIPNVLQSLRTYRLSSTATEVANLIQATRYEAIRANTNVSIRGQAVGNTFVIWIDRDGNLLQGATEPMAMLPSEIQFLPQASVPSIASMGPSYQNMQPAAGLITFNSRGTVSFGAGAPFVYGMFLGYPNAPTYGFRAVTLTPVGKTKVWAAGAGGRWN